MVSTKGLIGAAVIAAAVVAPLSSASACCYGHRYHGYHYGVVGGVFGLVGDVVVGAATIATAPIALAADVLTPQPYYDPAPRAYYAPRPYYGSAWGGYYGERRYYGPRRAYYRPHRDYGPPAGY
jgi:hypothetical protein